MKKYSILTVDLNKNITSNKRDFFYDELKDKKWIKIDALSTLWYASWKEDITDKRIIEITKNDIEKAAETAKIESFDIATAVCGTPVVWKK